MLTYRRARFLLAKTVTSPLNITLKSLRRLSSYHQITPHFLDFIDVYGHISGNDRDLRFSGFRTELYLQNPPAGCVIDDLGRSGRHYQLCYNMKTVVQKGQLSDKGSGAIPWKIRQAAIHHQFDVGTTNGAQVWVFGDPHGEIKDRVADIVHVQENHKHRFGTTSQSLKSSLDIHLEIARWSTGGWRRYILFLEETIQNLV
jgi:hypothetical protein